MNKSTPASRNAARDRVTPLERMENHAARVARAAALRISTSNAPVYVLGAAILVFGTIQPK